MTIRHGKAYSSPTTATQSLQSKSGLIVSPLRAKKRIHKEEGTIASVFATLSGGSLSDALPDRFRDLKKNIVQTELHAKALQKAWVQILAQLERETAEVIEEGESLIPQVQYPGDKIAINQSLDQWIDNETLGNIKKRGTFIVKGVIPEQTALKYKQDIQEYILANPRTKGALYIYFHPSLINLIDRD